MCCLPVSTGDVKEWIASVLGSDEEKSVAIIHRIVDEHDIDGKLLALLHKFPHELQAILPNFRARLLFLSALNNLIASSEQLVCLAPPTSGACGREADVTIEQEPKVEVEEEPCINSTQDGNRSLEEDIPVPVPLPVLDEGLLQAVEAGRLSERAIRNRMIAACARHYFELKRYPSQKDYNNICYRLLHEYPDLNDGHDNNGQVPIAQLKRMLSMAIRNLRRRKGPRYLSAHRLAAAIQKRYRDLNATSRMTRARLAFLTSPTVTTTTASETAESALTAVSSTTCAVPSAEDGEESYRGMSVVPPWGFIPSPPPMPTLDSRLRKAVCEGRLKERVWRVRFISRCAEFYTSLKPYPNRNDYYNVSLHLSRKYPDLGGPEDVKYALSMHIRNRRRIQKLHDGTPMATVTQKFPQTPEEPSPPPPPPLAADQLHLGIQSTTAIVDPVPLPPLDSALRRAIGEGKLNDRSVKNRFIRICAGFYMSIKSYPSKEDYNNICRRLITVFPELRDPSLIPGYPPFMQLKKTLTACIRNKRRECMMVRAASPECNEPNDGNVPQTEGSWEDLVVKNEPEMEPEEEEQQGDSILPPIPSPVPAVPQRSATMYGEIPVPAPLPTFTADLVDAMRGGGTIAGKVKSKFLHLCTEFYLRLKYYPSSEDYNNICASLVTAFPQLSDPGGYGGYSDCLTFVALKKDLSMYFRNFRHRHKVDKMRDEPGCIVGWSSSDGKTPRTQEDGVNSCDGRHRGASSGEDDTIPYPCPLPALPPGLEAALVDGGVPLEGRARSRLLQACAEFFVDLKYYPSKSDYGNICRTLMNTYPKLCATSDGISPESARRLRKDFSMHVRSVRHREKRDKGGSRSTRTLSGGSGGGGVGGHHVTGATGGGDMSVFDSFFNAAPTQEDVERNIQQLKCLISELK